jgi:hypothetical protein
MARSAGTPFHIQVKALLYRGESDEAIEAVFRHTVGTAMTTFIMTEVADLRRWGRVPNHIEAQQGAPATWPKVSALDARQFVDVADPELRPWQYAYRYNLPHWATAAGKAQWGRASQLWANSDVRQLLCTLLLCRDVDDSKALATAKLYYPYVMSRYNKADVSAFRTLYWDFSGWSMSTLLSFLEVDADFKGARYAVALGKEAALFALGLISLDMRHEQMFQAVRNHSYLHLTKMAVLDDRFNPRDYKEMYAVFQSAVQYLDGKMDNDELPFEEYVSNMKLIEEEDFASLDEIVAGASRGADQELVLLARRNGRLTESDAAYHMIAIEKGAWPDRHRQHVRSLLSLDDEPEDTADVPLATPVRKAKKMGTKRRSAG